ncbi:protein phosphatase 2C domain-containing protein [Dactylosporangium sp. NPDC049525]|uniref:protein phosphatase 2C domain-containing protein n=1 Tax=Dactylosporangium sp. NPDC049525 TaxID=3154730 RepID=UPI0034308EC3
MNPLTFWALVVFALAVLLACVIYLRRTRLPVKKTKAGQEVTPTRGGKEPRPEPRSGSRADARSDARSRLPSESRHEPQPESGPAVPRQQSEGWASRSALGILSKTRREPSPPATTTVDPKLTAAPVVLEAAWQQSVYHGACSAGRFRATVRVATARGSSHAYGGTAGQDVAGVVWNERRRAVFAVVADGLGSKVDSGQLAREVVEQTLARAEGLRPEQDPLQMLHGIIRYVEAFVIQNGLDGATTLVVAEIRADTEGAVVSTWGIGDSEAWVLERGNWGVLHHERRADTENVTRHLPGHRDVQQKSTLVGRGAVVTVASDGFAAALATRGNSPVSKELIDRWRKPPAPTDFLNQVNFDDPRFHDDRAAVAVWIR